ncbi:MAG: 23S rRNA (uracil(1939)-C(5))-methyltransferase RlmD [Lachnospiraceae bacterium]|nr:23S rRNA (uracil(1939)-C(5))-methyltransferase RlmD [Lachnospiraceae bacterium]
MKNNDIHAAANHTFAVAKTDINREKNRNISTKSDISESKSFKKTNRNVKDVRCPAAGKCGGCDWLGRPYEKQLADKKKLVADLLKPYCRLEGIIPMETPYFYRNKVHAVFDRDRRGAVIAGTYEKNSHRVVAVEKCLIEDEKAGEIIRTIRDLCKSFQIRIYDEDSGYGLLRHVLVRAGHTSGQYLVVLVLSSPILPDKNNFIKALRKAHPEITSVVINVNDRRTSMILGEKEQVIYGKGYIEDTLCGKTFRISPKSFYQVNPVQTQKLYQKAIEYADFRGNERIVDAYCGIDTIGIVASDHVKEVIGVELNKDAVRDARVNARINCVRNISFYENDAGQLLTQMAQQKAKVDAVILDPPRSGSDEAFLSSVIQIAPAKVVYISCNPVTLARDLEYLTKRGYRAMRACAVDMFPQTAEHVEACVLLEKAGKAQPGRRGTVDRADGGMPART